MRRIASFKTVLDFQSYVSELGLELPCDTGILRQGESPLGWPVKGCTVNGKPIGNRCVVHPMEGWDGTGEGGITEEVRQRWSKFGLSGAKLIFGGEALAVCAEGRANPRQLLITESHRPGLSELVATLKRAHQNQGWTTDDLVVGFQLTHSGRFSRPNHSAKPEPIVAYRHPLLDRRVGVTDDSQVISDSEVERLVQRYADAALVARDAGADFVDIKHCHGYLLHEFLGAKTRTGKYGGSFENRTRPLREIVQAIRASGNTLDLAVRLSAFDLVPFRPDPERSAPGRPGCGIPEDFRPFLPYRYGFGVNSENPLEIDLDEPLRFLGLCAELGIKIVNLSAGSPYYNPHIQRPAAYPPSDGYQSPEDPLVGVARQIQAARWLRERAPRELLLVGTGYTYLQDYLPHVAQAVVRNGWVDLVGIGRMVLSYPEFFTDILREGKLAAKKICRTFSECTTAPRLGMISGCYPLDPLYSQREEAARLKALKRALPEIQPGS